VVLVVLVKPLPQRLLPQELLADLNPQPRVSQDLSLRLQAEPLELPEELPLRQESREDLRLEEQAAAPALIARRLLAWPEPLAASLAAAAAAALPPTTDSRLALAVLAALARSTSSPTANL
jgi:hypothetical protein